MNVYCINLDSRKDRLDYIRAEFERVGVEFNRVSAVDGSDEYVVDRASALPAMWNGRKMSPSVYACLQSHRRIWNILATSKDRSCAVFEDDMVLADDIGELIDDSWLPAEFDLVKLETFSLRVHLARSCEFRSGQRQFFRLRSSHFGSGAYIVSREGAIRLLKATEDFSNPVDYIFSDRVPLFENLITYQAFPAPAIQGERLSIQAGWSNRPDWVSGSIVHRVESGEGVDVPRAERFAARLTRRFTEEMRALSRHTRYRFVPWG